jgi:DNA-directed RNA polymerase specialized sigma24 family protein
MESVKGDHGGQHRADHDDQHRVDRTQTWLQTWLRIWLENLRKLKRRARRLIGLNGGEVMEADDLLQLTLLRVLRINKSPEEVLNPPGYLLRMLRNTWVDELKKAKKPRAESLEAILGDPAQSKKLPSVRPEVFREEEEAERQRKFQSLRVALTAEEDALLEAFLDDPTLETYAAASHEDVCRTKMRWNKLRGKLIRLAVIRGLSSKDEEDPKQPSEAPNSLKKRKKNR